MPRLLALLSIVAPLSLAAPATAPKIDFAREIRPILSDRCFTCHGPDEQNRKANLRLDTREGLKAKPGVVVPDNAAKSRLIARITSKSAPMPPTGPPLTDAQVTKLRQWIDSGAPWTEHWSYAPPQRPAEPVTKDTRWPQNPIDRFLLARLEKEGLRPSPEADRATLLRRLSFDLTGLPPTPEEVAAFLNDKSPGAWAKQVDRLLASPRYGERMTLQWLDLSRYADTHGFHIDSHRDMWRWRDWVINAFNQNKPFNTFIVEQLAGDLLPGATKEQILASGFNRNHMINFEGGAIPEEYQNEYVVDRVETTAMTFMAMTMGCARCHDHKYDPISQKDFYRFAAFFNTLPEKGLDGQRGNAAPLLELPTETQAQRQKYVTERLPAVEKQLKATRERFAQWTPRFEATAPTQGLLAHYEFDGAFTDSSGHYHHGRSLRDEGSFPNSQTGDRALELNGRSEVELGKLPFTPTVALWFQTRARTFKNGILARQDSQRQGWELFLDAPYAIPRLRQKADLVLRKVERWPDRVWEARLEEHLLLPRGRNVWFHIAWAGDQIYINGELRKIKVTKNTLTKPFAENDALATTIGGRVEADRLRGRIDDLRFYDRPLSAREIQILAKETPLAINAALPKRVKEQEDALFAYWAQQDKEAGALKQELEALETEKDDLEWEIPSVMVMKESDKPRDTFVLARGDYQNKKEKVTPGVPASLPPLPANAPANRLTLAQWLADGNHPLTARVAINRFWQNYFGAGLVKTSEDFGSQGETPVHRELLDWLATEFVRTGWDVKAMQRMIVMSAAYRQSSRLTPALKEKDPENRLLARGPRHRLQAEMLRDNALAVSGLLNPAIGGPSVLPYQPSGLWEELAFGAEFSAQVYEQSHGDDLYRRSMYTFWKRTAPPAMLNLFDAPDREKCIARRPMTNTPLQALALLNDPTYVEAARAFAQRVIQEAGPDTGQRLYKAFQLALARKPSSQERTILANLAKRKLSDYQRQPNEADALLKTGESKPAANIPKTELAAWTTVMSVILNLDETLTKE